MRFDLLAYADDASERRPRLETSGTIRRLAVNPGELPGPKSATARAPRKPSVMTSSAKWSGRGPSRCTRPRRNDRTFTAPGTTGRGCTRRGRSGDARSDRLSRLSADASWRGHEHVSSRDAPCRPRPPSHGTHLHLEHRRARGGGKGSRDHAALGMVSAPSLRCDPASYRSRRYPAHVHRVDLRLSSDGDVRADGRTEVTALGAVRDPLRKHVGFPSRRELPSSPASLATPPPAAQAPAT